MLIILASENEKEHGINLKMYLALTYLLLLLTKKCLCIYFLLTVQNAVKLRNSCNGYLAKDFHENCLKLQSQAKLRRQV